MVESIGGLSNLTDIVKMQAMQRAAVATGNTKVQEEFMAIFYKELLKQAFTPPSFSLDDEEDQQNSTFKSAITNDIMIDKLALELAKRQAFSFKKVAE